MNKKEYSFRYKVELCLVEAKLWFIMFVRYITGIIRSIACAVILSFCLVIASRQLSTEFPIITRTTYVQAMASMQKIDYGKSTFIEKNVITKSQEVSTMSRFTDLQGISVEYQTKAKRFICESIQISKQRKQIEGRLLTEISLRPYIGVNYDNFWPLINLEEEVDLNFLEIFIIGVMIHLEFPIEGPSKITCRETPDGAFEVSFPIIKV